MAAERPGATRTGSDRGVGNVGTATAVFLDVWDKTNKGVK
jgi:hypothetical protein